MLCCTECIYIYIYTRITTVNNYYYGVLFRPFLVSSGHEDTTTTTGRNRQRYLSVVNYSTMGPKMNNVRRARGGRRWNGQCAHRNVNYARGARHYNNNSSTVTCKSSSVYT